MTTATTPPAHDEILRAVRASGSAVEDFFGFPLRDDGLYLAAQFSEPFWYFGLEAAARQG